MKPTRATVSRQMRAGCLTDALFVQSKDFRGLPERPAPGCRVLDGVLFERARGLGLDILSASRICKFRQNPLLAQ